MTYRENGSRVRELRWEDRVQGAADVLGLIPVLNIPAEIVSGLISLRKRDYLGAALSAAGLVPFEGEWAVALKIARATKQAAHTAATAGRVAQAVKVRDEGAIKWQPISIAKI